MDKIIVEIPMKNTDEVIEINLEKLPEYEEIITILKSENSNLNLWVDLALEYYKRGNSKALVSLLEMSRSNACLDYTNSDVDQMKALDMLGAYYLRKANQEKDKNKRTEFVINATQLSITGDKIKMYDTTHLLCRAYLCLLESDKVDQANTQFNFVLNQSANNIPAQLGKAIIAYNKNDYKEALAYYKKALRSNPQCPAEVRLGLAYCFLKLKNEEKAHLAFKRVLELNSMCVDALVGLAIINLNSGNLDSIKLGINMLSKACNMDPNNPMVLNHLSNHFFFKKDYVKCELLAQHALKNTDNEAIMAESYYQMARIYHVQAIYNKAFQYYYQAIQLASSKFILPYYGLGQMYIQGGDIENAAQCFEKVLRFQPDNYESMKILSSLYASTNNQQKREIAKVHLKKITARIPEDIEAWIELAQIMEQSDLLGSLSAYNKVINLMQKSGQNDIPPEILNNVAALHYRLGNLDESQLKLKESLIASKNIISANLVQYDSCISITITYNLARLLEAQCQFQNAEILYKNILKEHPNYIDCYLRLGCMARDRNQIYEASDWFKEVLRIDINNPNAWTLLGNLHFSKMEWGPSQKKFERVLKNPLNINDSYILTSIGNIWLQTLYQPIKDNNKMKRHQELALQYYTKVLKNDPKNIYAANGIGCILATKNYINEAKDIFFQVREATAEFCDVWLNIAHICIKQEQYNNAIQMYENCMKKFFKHDNIEVLQYLGRAYVKAGNFKKAKTTFLKARRVAPADNAVLYNVAYVLQKLSAQILDDKESNLNDVLKAVKELKLSHRYFLHLSTNRSHIKYSVTMAGFEAKQCQKLLVQADSHVIRARKKDHDECELRRKQKEERDLIRENQIKEHNKVLKQQEEEHKQMILKRHQFIEKTKNATIFNQNKRCQNDVESDENIESDPGVNRRSKPTKLKNSGNDKKKKIIGTAKRQRVSDRRILVKFDNNKPASKKGHSERALSTKQKIKITSKATISSSENDSSTSEVKIKTSGHFESFAKSGNYTSKRSSKPQSGWRISRFESGSSSSNCSRSSSRSSSSHSLSSNNSFSKSLSWSGNNSSLSHTKKKKIMTSSKLIFGSKSDSHSSSDSLGSLDF